MRLPLALVAAVIVVSALPALAQTRYVRDKVHINVRTGPGNKYKIQKVLKSGETVRTLGDVDGWVNVRLTTGKQGWVPSGYLVREPPPSITLPKVREELEQANTKIGELQALLDEQGKTLGEIEGLRERNQKLETQYTVLSNSSWFKAIATGGFIAFVGILVGAAWPRGGKNRRLKL